MKKVLKGFFLVCVSIGLALSFNVPAFASDLLDLSELDEIKPYALIVEQANEKLGKEIIKIPTNDDFEKMNLSREEVYKKITSFSLNEFESHVMYLCSLADSIELDVHIEVPANPITDQLKDASESESGGAIEISYDANGEQENISPAYINVTRHRGNFYSYA